MWRPWLGESSVEQPEGVQVQPECGNKNRRHLSLDAKEIIKNVFTTLIEREKLSKMDCVEETATLTKVPKKTVWKIVNKPITERKRRKDSGTCKKLDGSDEDLVRRKIYKMYEEQTVPTLDNLLKRLEIDNTGINCGRTTLWKCLQCIGFKFKKVDKRQVIMESQRLKAWRFEYLTKIAEYRSKNRPIIYLDETWFDTHDTPSKGWVDSSDRCKTKAPSNRGKRITIIHAGSEDGWVPNALSLAAKNINDSSLDYHQDTTAELFEDWFVHNLIPNIPPNSVIVMDNASYHSRQLNKHPCSKDTKMAIQEFMYQNDIYFHESYTKRELLDVFKILKIEKEYYCDSYAKSKGHTVLRLPPYHCIFNPIEHIWHQLKSAVRRNNVSPTINASVLDIITTEVDKIPVSSWENCVSHIKTVEHSYIHIENTTERFIINVGVDSDSETELNE